MTKQITISLILLTAACFLLMYVISVWSTENAYKGGGFKRTFPTRRILQAIDTVDIGYSTYYVAGHSAQHVYLGSYAGPRSIISVNRETLDTQNFEFKVIGNDVFTLSSIKVMIDSPYIYMTDGTVPVIYKGGLDSLRVYPEHVSGYFLDIGPMSTSIYLIKSLTTEKTAALGLLNLNPPGITIKRGILEKQIDGLFCNEGTMLFDKARSNVVYVYTYRNKFVVLDSNLNVVQTGKTIDTTEHAKIQVTEDVSRKQVILSSPPWVVNRKAWTRNGVLYINSALMADNEDPLLVDETSVIDVYDLNKNEYMGSFYVPRGKTDKLIDFCVFDNQVLALYGSKLISFQFSQRIFTSTRSPPLPGSRKQP